MAVQAVTGRKKRYVRLLGDGGPGTLVLQASRIYTERTELTATERRLYEAIYAADGALVPQQDLLLAMYGEKPEYDGSERASLKTYVYRLRRLGVEITNVWGVGYALGSKRCPTCGVIRR